VSFNIKIQCNKTAKLRIVVTKLALVEVMTGQGIEAKSLPQGRDEHERWLRELEADSPVARLPLSKRLRAGRPRAMPPSPINKILIFAPLSAEA
jgi:hypothetical protein